VCQPKKANEIGLFIAKMFSGLCPENEPDESYSDDMRTTLGRWHRTKKAELRGHLTCENLPAG
jgi:hypothetical protein